MPDARACVRVRAAGAMAAAALARCAGRTAPVPAFPHAPYRFAGDEMVWIGHHGAMHPRAVFARHWQGGDLLDIAAASVWHAPPPDFARLPVPSVVTHLLDCCAARRPTSGFAPLLWGGTPMFPMRARTAEAGALACAVADDAPPAFLAAAARLIGVGNGLTPSGDDLVGAALFGLRRWRGADIRWRDASASLCRVARERTHAISAVLFADLASGASFAPLHALADALCSDAPAGALAPHLEDLVAIGHSSGWDMLAGIVAATGRAFPHTPA
jgi:hypothetical protein